MRVRRWKIAPAVVVDILKTGFSSHLSDRRMDILKFFEREIEDRFFIFRLKKKQKNVF